MTVTYEPEDYAEALRDIEAGHAPANIPIVVAALRLAAGRLAGVESSVDHQKAARLTTARAEAAAARAGLLTDAEYCESRASAQDIANAEYASRGEPLPYRSASDVWRMRAAALRLAAKPPEEAIEAFLETIRKESYVLDGIVHFHVSEDDLDILKFASHLKGGKTP